MNKEIIEIFMLNEVLNNKLLNNNSSCGCGCNCGESNSFTIDQLVERFNEKYHFSWNFKIYKITKENKKDFIEKINKIMLDSGERLILDESNLDFILPKIVPLISVSGKVISVKNYPNEEQLYKAISTGKRIEMKSGCC